MRSCKNRELFSTIILIRYPENSNWLLRINGDSVSTMKIRFVTRIKSFKIPMCSLKVKFKAIHKLRHRYFALCFGKRELTIFMSMLSSYNPLETWKPDFLLSGGIERDQGNGLKSTIILQVFWPRLATLLYFEIFYMTRPKEVQ